jgi:hypothetical protein
MNPVFPQRCISTSISTSNPIMRSEIASATLRDRKQAAAAHCLYSKQASGLSPQSLYCTPHHQTTLEDSKNMKSIPVASPVSVVCESQFSPTSEMFLCSSPSKTTSLKRRRVQFQEMQSIRFEERDSEEAGTRNFENSVWYSKQELSEFKRDAKRACKRAWTENESDLDHVYPSFNHASSNEGEQPTPSSTDRKSDDELYSVRIY